MNFFKQTNCKFLISLVVIHLLIRLFLAYFLEMGNDEVYYIKYVEFPDWSHFDHPIMIQILGKITTINLLFTHPFFFRLGNIFLGTLSIFFIYKLASYIHNEHAAKWSVLLYLSSIYTSIISGLFFMPDGALSFFWIVSLYFGVRFIQEEKIAYFLLFHLTSCFAIASKYQAIFLPFALFLFILTYRRSFLLNFYCYLGFFIAFLGFIPSLLWNISHDFISFSFHQNRVGEAGFSLDYFFREIIGEILYNNLISVILYIIIFYTQLKEKKQFSKTDLFLGFTAFPLIIVSIMISLATETLPHWSAPAYFAFSILSGSIIAKNQSFQKWTRIAFAFSFFIMILGFVEIQYGFIMNMKTQKQSFEQKGKHDFTQDMYGWQQLGKEFSSVAKKYPEVKYVAINRWYPASHLDYYVSKPNRLHTEVFGDYKALHEYLFIQNKRTKPKPNTPYFFIESSNRSMKINTFVTENFDKNTTFNCVDTIAILRRNDTVRYEVVYLIDNL